MIERRRLRQMFLSAFESEDLDYAGGGCQVVHHDLTWSMTLVVDGAGKLAPYRLVLGCSLPQIVPAPRRAEDCQLVLPLPYEGSTTVGSVPRMPDAVFPEWSGTDDLRATVIARSVVESVRYARQVTSLEQLRVRHVAGDYDGAFVAAPMRRILELGR